MLQQLCFYEEFEKLWQNYLQIPSPFQPIVNLKLLVRVIFLNIIKLLATEIWSQIMDLDLDGW